MDDDPRPYYAEFIKAAEASAQGNHSLAQDLVSRNPIVAGELRAFVRAIKAGRLIHTSKGWRMAKGAGD